MVNQQGQMMFFFKKQYISTFFQHVSMFQHFFNKSLTVAPKDITQLIAYVMYTQYTRARWAQWPCYGDEDDAWYMDMETWGQKLGFSNILIKNN